MWIIIAALVFLCFCGGVAMIVTAWRVAEYLLNGIVGGVRLFCKGACGLFLASWRLSRWSRRQWKRVGLWTAQWAYARLYGGGYRLRRGYIASELKRRRAARA